MSDLETPIPAQPILRAQFSATQRSLLALFSGAVGIALAPIFVRLSPVGPSATAFWRLALALPVFFIWMSLEGQKRSASQRPVSRAEWSSLAVAGLFLLLT